MRSKLNGERLEFDQAREMALASSLAIVCWRWVGLLVWGIVCVAVLCTAGEAQAKRVVGFDVSRSEISQETWSDLSSLLVKWVIAKRESEPAIEADGRLHKVAKVAYLLGPENRAAVLLHAKLRDQKSLPPSEEAVEDDAVIAKLLESGRAARAVKSRTDQQIARYLFAVGLIIDPKGEDCVYESEVCIGQHGPINWSPLLEDYALAVSVPDGYQQAINGLVVMTNNNVEVGQVGKILLTYHAKSNRTGKGKLDVKFVRNVGHQMRVSLKEAVRYWRKYSAGLKLQPGTIEISWEEKYIPKDGGSAAAAFTVLIRAFSDQFSIDDQFAMTGDISVEGRVLRIGGVFAKVRGAYLDGCTRVGIPEENVEDLVDAVILNGREILSQIEIYALETVEDAIALAREDKDQAILDATNEWSKIVSALADDQWQESDEVQAMLDQVQALCPSHLSARLLSQIKRGEFRQHLSLTRSLDHLSDILSRYFAQISEDNHITLKEVAADTSLTHIDEAIHSLEKARSALDAQADEAHTELQRTCEHLAQYVRMSNLIIVQKENLEESFKNVQRAREQLEKIKDRLDRNSTASVTQYNTQVDRVQRMVRIYENKRGRVNDLIEKRNELTDDVITGYEAYLAASRSLGQDMEALEKLIRGR